MTALVLRRRMTTLGLLLVGVGGLVVAATVISNPWLRPRGPTVDLALLPATAFAPALTPARVPGAPARDTDPRPLAPALLAALAGRAASEPTPPVAPPPAPPPRLLPVRVIPTPPTPPPLEPLEENLWSR